MRKQILPIFMLLSFTWLFTSCSDASGKCGAIRNSAFPIITPTLFSQLLVDPIYEGDASYETFYYAYNGRSTFGFYTEVKHVCSQEPILVSPTLVLKVADANFRDSIRFQSGGAVLKNAVLPSNGVVYLLDQIYSFNTAEAETSYEIVNNISFPSQGSSSADSIYFFSNLSSFGFSSKYNTIK